MYCDFYGFREKPFSITPDPKFLFLGATHKEAFAHLVYGIRERGGFITITGEIGTGKTTLCRALLSHLSEDTLVAFILNPTLSAIELLKSINEDFGIPSTGETRKDLIDELNRFLLQKRREGKNTVLIIDEAQNLDPEVLEHIRLLSNLETDTEKLLQIILIGQPEFRSILARPALQQLNQRVTVRYHLQPLSREETEAYIRHRLSIAGAEDKVRFSPKAVKKIYAYSGGIPRLINVLCDRCLLAGYSLGRRDIDASMVERAQREVAGTEDRWAGATWMRALRKGLLPGILLAVFVVLVAYGFHLLVSRSPGPSPSPAGSARPRSLVEGSAGKGIAPKRSESRPAVSGKVGAIQPADLSGPQTAGAGLEPEEKARTGALPSAEGQEGLVVSSAPQAVPAAFPEGVERPPGNPSGLRPDVLAVPEGKGLVDSLARRSILESRRLALAGVLEKWGLLSPSSEEDAPGLEKSLSLDLFAGARTFGLQCSRFRGNLNRIRALNLPVILEMAVGENPPKRYLALIGLDGAVAEVCPGLDDGTRKVPAEVIEKYWYGSAYLFWKDPFGEEMYLREGTQGRQVLWIQNALKELGYLSNRPSGIFDADTTLALMAFQSDHLLDEDGIAGPQTRVLLQRALKVSDMPVLSGSTRLSGDDPSPGAKERAAPRTRYLAPDT
jgi:general secretion pathway protein A